MELNDECQIALSFLNETNKSVFVTGGLLFKLTAANTLLFYKLIDN